MRKFIIEREAPGLGRGTAEQLRAAVHGSNEALGKVGPGIQWQQSYVTADGTYCVYLAENEELIREHARRIGTPVKRIVEVRAILDPSSAESPR
jgi:hypothetical protein